VDTAEYAILLALAAAGGAGVPVVGDAALIAAALAAADGHLSIAVVLVAAFGGHKIGRAIAYQLGLRGGRPLLERPGWFEGVRSRAVTKGDQLFKRFPRAAPLIAPAPLSGIHRVSLAMFVLASIVTGLTWMLSSGLIPYEIGETATDLIGRIGVVEGVLFVALLAAVLLVHRYGRRRLFRAGPADGGKADRPRAS
jgi:membrane protein DedA with SNARE-associated domain